MTTIHAAAQTVQPTPVQPPTTGWIIRRAILGLVIMLAVTGIAAMIAHASIDAADGIVDEIKIGAPATALLKR
jgi:hypothetical protein